MHQLFILLNRGRCSHTLLGSQRRGIITSSCKVPRRLMHTLCLTIVIHLNQVSSKSRSSSYVLRCVVTSAGIVCSRRLEFGMGCSSTEIAVVEAGKACEVGKVVVLVAVDSYLR